MESTERDGMMGSRGSNYEDTVGLRFACQARSTEKRNNISRKVTDLIKNGFKVKNDRYNLKTRECATGLVRCRNLGMEKKKIEVIRGFAAADNPNALKLLKLSNNKETGADGKIKIEEWLDDQTRVRHLDTWVDCIKRKNALVDTVRQVDADKKINKRRAIVRNRILNKHSSLNTSRV